MKNFLKNIGKHIIPEGKFFLFRAIPIAVLILSPLFVILIYTWEMTLFKSDYEMWLYAFGSSFAGIYLARIMAFLVKKNITRQSMVKADIYYEEAN